MTKSIAALSRLAQGNSLHPAVIVAGVVIVAATAKLGCGTWGISGLLAFYPAYLAAQLVRDSVALIRPFLPGALTRAFAF